MSNLIFNELNLSKEVQKAISEMGFEEATPIQSKSIPHILDGKDVIGQAQTGTGKTCAFGIPIVEMINPVLSGIQALVLCPTRELAIQSAEEIKKVSKYKKGLRILPIYGGQPIERQISALKQRPQVIIGTPGRIMDHMRRNTLQFTNLKMLILDEADEMLNMGFRDDIDIILQKVPAQKQMILFSATMPKEIMDLTAKYQKDPILIKAVHQELTVPNIEQYYLEVRESTKLDTLSRLIDANNIKLSLVFCNTKSRVDELASHLQSRGYLAESLHGDMRQAQRDKVMAKFRKGAIDILIATDVAARGIDVDDIEAVFNYDLPNDEEYYVHRIGRTGRAGRTGKAFTFISGREIYKLKDIQRYTKSKILPKKAPSLVDVEDSKINKIMEDLKGAIKEGHLTKYVATVEKFLETTELQNEQDNDITTLDIAAAFLKMATQPNGTSIDAEPSIDSEHHGNGTNKSMSRLFINAGRDIKLQPKQLIQATTSCTSIPEKMIGDINIYEKFSFIEVPAQFTDEFLNTMKHYKINGRKINVERANSK